MNFQITSVHVTSAVQKQLGVFLKCHFMSTTPTVVQLAVYLENGQHVYFNTHTAAQVAAGEVPRATLTSFLSLCVNDPFAKTLIYSDVPRCYTWNQSNEQWDRRKRETPTETPGIFETSTVGRIYTVSPKQGECF